ncbi:hypothetical protein G8C92_04435 [Paenibacillus donghaensis]|uniref:hypothetical protein n=1 Tax=Paenibacillus donghaensis TaxID=414771 RepID=UPI001884163E|nr:hypothetical protein [Paenibacillus donghaensis]MBE9913289.1 hypothetical protein [Paenibacillus donghaensis]
MKPDTLSKEDLCIVKDDDSKSKVCFGMSRADAEKVLGTGVKEMYDKYDYGVSVIYRDGKTVSVIILDADSKNVYSTIRGLKSGDSKETVLKLYGDKYPIMRETEPHTVDYVYDLKNKKFIGEVSFKNIDRNSYKDHLFFSAEYKDDQVKRIYISDLQGVMMLN